MPNLIDLTGKTFQRWTVLHRATDGASKQVRWACRCECGAERSVSAQSLRNGTSKSCGCFAVEVATDQIVARNLRHGLSKSRTHNIWCGIKTRCTNPNVPAYPRYGGRGIAVCEEWLSFDNFLADMGECPDGFTIERVNNDLGYDKENCKWSTYKEQQNNRSNNRLIECNGETKTLAQWSDISGVKRTTLAARLDRGWSPEKAMS